jgi:hypothetical protein
VVDAGIKKTRIKQNDLPPMNVDSEGYILRYRILSEDKNRVSHWSPVEVIMPGYTFVPGSIDHNKTGGISNIAWNAVTIKKNNNVIRTATEYDIWIRWDRNDGGDWEYRSRMEGTSVSLLTPTTYTINGVTQSNTPNKVSIEVYLKGNPVTRNSTLLRVYQGGPWTV